MLSLLTLPGINNMIIPKGDIMEFVDLSGKKYGRLTVLGRAENTRRNKVQWLCKCDCKNETLVPRDDLKSGDTKSCGCYKIEKLINPNTEIFTYQRKRKYIPHPKNLSLEEKLDRAKIRFNKKTDKSGDCWIWKGLKDKNGYGVLYYAKIRTAHRFSFFLKNGQIQEGKIICHTCDNPSCVNPDHLYAGTHQSNSDDKFARNRQKIIPRTSKKIGATI